jgi:hypothetical protein
MNWLGSASTTKFRLRIQWLVLQLYFTSVTIGYIAYRNQPLSCPWYKATINRAINHREHLVQIRNVKVWEERPIVLLVYTNTVSSSQVHSRLSLLSKV